MKTSCTLLLATAIGGSLAAPADNTGLKFSVDTTHNPKQRHPLTDANHVIRKFKGVVDSELQSVLQNRVKPSSAALNARDGSVINYPPGTDGVDNLYVSEVSIGTPAQKLNLDFDTGSSDLWVFSTDTDPSETEGQTLYRPGSSTSAKKQAGETWAIGYGDGSQSSGVVYNDVVTIGGISVNNQAVESAKKVSKSFSDNKLISGLLGLAYDSGNTVQPSGQKTWFSNILPKLSKGLFTVRLRHQTKGSYNFGYIDKSQYTGAISYTGAFTDDLGHRLFKASGYSVGGGKFKTASITGTADTGSSLLYLPTSVANAYWAKVQGSQANDIGGGQTLWTFDCDTTLPDFTFGVGSTGRVTVAGANINYAPNDDTTCIGGLAATSDSLAIFGDVALKSNLVIYDDDNQQIGWAKGL